MKTDSKEIKTLNKLITNKEIDLIIKSFSTKKSQWPDDFRGELNQTFKVELILILKNERGETTLLILWDECYQSQTNTSYEKKTKDHYHLWI